MPNKVLILGSGALKIGQAGEFDYSGSQAIKALNEERIKTILINPNIATVQTSKGLADKVYFLPVNKKFVIEVIKKENPDSILLSFGGQTALNVGVDLYNSGILKKYNIKVLGTPVDSILKTEDRQLFVNELNSIDVKSAKSITANNVEQSLDAAQNIGYPVMIRGAFSLGGKGSGVAKNKEELITLSKKAFASLNQILIEEYLFGWKEVEYEVVRDIVDNCITVCNMENMDPMGIHTGESIVVAPSQTLNDDEYHNLRKISIKVIRHLGIIGECNIQYALNPKNGDYRVIEVNARLSRSSALASKATGYPLAYIAAKLGLGFTLYDLPNNLNKKTKAFFEPALDYVVIKFPKWDLQKFSRVAKRLGSEMKSVGEVMSIGRTFEETLQKSIRMLNIGKQGITDNDIKFKNLKESLKFPTDKRIFAIADSLKNNMSIDDIHDLTKIDKWFLYKIKNIVKNHEILSKNDLTKELLRNSKKLGFSDHQIAKIKNINEDEVRKLRKEYDIKPHVKKIDTLAAEYPTFTNYLYLTYHGNEDDNVSHDNSILVIGSGSYKIGSSVEFDWCCVNAVKTAKNLGYKTIMINYNPETVSTDYDECDSLYFDEITYERILDIYELEKTKGVIVSMGGQIANNLAYRLHKNNVNILGTSPDDIDNAENRHKFSKILDKLNIDQPKWKELTTVDEIGIFAEKVGYPVIVRPSYVLSGAAMSIVENKKYLKEFLDKASLISKDYPVVVSKFIDDAKEIEMDAVAKNGEIIIYAISEHIENAGVHSGDATVVYPAQKIYLETYRKIKLISKKIVKEFNITGPFNIQFIAKENNVKVIECNLRVSRSFPFVSKISKVNFIDIAMKCILGYEVDKIEIDDLEYVGVKSPQFSFSRLKGADPVSFIEMASTGEVACIGNNLNDAFLKSMISVNFKIPKKNILLSTGTFPNKLKFVESAKVLHNLGYRLYATNGTGEFLKSYNIPIKILNWPLTNKTPNVIDYIKNKKIDLVINIPKNYYDKEITNDYLIRRTAIDFNIQLITNIQLANKFVEAISLVKEFEIKSWDEY
jgi:carbamoyl-phosphate synthase large subunit